MQYILSHKTQLITFFVAVSLSVLLVALYVFGASLVDTDSVGIGTTTVGAGLYVNEGFSSVLSDELYVFGRVNIPFLVSTSTTASSFAGGVGVGTTTPGTARFEVNEGWDSLLAGDTYVYGALNVPFVNATSTTATTTLSNLIVDTSTLVVDPTANKIAIATTTFPAVGNETMTITAGSAAASTTLYLGGTASMIILRSTDGKDCIAISAQQGSIVADGGSSAVALEVEAVTCPE